MNIITKKVWLIPAPFVGTRIGITIPQEIESLRFGFGSANLAEGSESVTVDWGDGVIEMLDTLADRHHEYTQAGDFEIKISDDLYDFVVSSSHTDSENVRDYAPKVRSVDSNAVRLSRLGAYCFAFCSNLESIELNCPNLIEFGSAVFCECLALSGVIDLPTVSKIKGSSTLPFENCHCVSEIRFASAHKEELLVCPAFANWENTHLGASNAEVSFIL